MAAIYSAAKSQAQGRPGWSISFRHPLRRDARKKPGLKVRRGLGTTSGEEADGLVSQMNALLSDESWWSAARREEASGLFDQRIVEAFFDEIEPAAADNRALRDGLLPLPGRPEGYSRALFVGTTGAGKTSVVRHLIGSDPDEDRFPSTSTAKTTIAETEIVLAEGPFEAVVTFFSEAETRVAIEECVINACSSALEGAPDERVAERFLNHPDQRFRLGYALGTWRKSLPKGAAAEADNDWNFDDGDNGVSPTADDLDAVTLSEAQANQTRLESYVERVRGLVASVAVPLLKTLDIRYEKATPDDRDTALDLIESELHQSGAFVELIHDVIDDIQDRFALVDAGEFNHKRSGWPLTWTYQSSDRADFIRQVRWFSSNYAPSFGRLLTPLVDGVRVKGPLYPGFTAAKPKLVLLDGQGLGHTPDSSSSVTTQITRRFAEADIILLVDNAEQPVQASPLAVLAAVGTSGHYGKLAVVFTHFDQVKGDNLPTANDKREHVLASVRNGIVSLREIVGGAVANSLVRALDTDAYMLGNLQMKNSKLPGGVVRELDRLLERCRQAIEPAPAPEVAPQYSLLGLDFAVQAATNKFHDRWSTRLGLAVRAGVQKEHWTRIKALNRRIIIGQDHFNSLQPVADLIRELQTQVSRFLDEPRSWSRQPDNEEEAQEALALVRQAVFATLHDLARSRIIDKEQAHWQRANDLRGTGSAFERAQELDSIFHDAAPIPGPAMPPKTVTFLGQVRELVAEAIEAGGGHVDGTAGIGPQPT